MSDKFSLKWNDFETNVSKSFRLLRTDDDFSDVTVVSSDQQQLSAHKVVLSSCSEYFKNILRRSKHPNPLLCLEGISSEELNNIMDYIYNGKVQIYQENLQRFMEIAVRFQLDGLIRGDTNFDESNINGQSSEPSNEVDEWLSEEKELPVSIREDTVVFNTVKSLTKKISKTNFGESNIDVDGHSDEPSNEVDEWLSEEKELPVSIQEDTVVSYTEKARRNAPNKKIQNFVCDFKNIEELDKRILEFVERDSDGMWRCTVCSKVSKGINPMKHHVETHIEGLSFPCSYCGKECR